MSSTNTLTGTASDALSELNNWLANAPLDDKYKVELAPAPGGHAVIFKCAPVEPAEGSLLAGVLELAEVIAPARVKDRETEHNDLLRDAFCTLTGLASTYAPGSADESYTYFPAGDLLGPSAFFGEGAEIFVDDAGRAATNFPYNSPISGEDQLLIATISKPGPNSVSPGVGRDKISEVRFKPGKMPYVQVEYKLPGLLENLDAEGIRPILESVGTVYAQIIAPPAKQVCPA
ncbi:MAG: hypothetical protein V1820_00695 [archaeon]